MNRRRIAAKLVPQITIRVSGKLFQGHLPYVEQLVQSAVECDLWPQLNLEQLEELDPVAIAYLVEGEGRDFGIVACPKFVRERMDREKGQAAAA
jgi:hypothetical protein